MRVKQPAPIVVQQQPDPVDPLIEQQRVQAQNSDISAIRDGLRFTNEQMIQRYGARVSLLGRKPLVGF